MTFDMTVGQVIPEYRGRQEGVYLSIDGTGLTVSCLYDSPTSKERHAFKERAPLAVCVARKYDLMVMCLRFGAQPWVDCTYTPHIGAEPILQPVEGGQGYAMIVRLVDTSTGILVAQRLVSLGTEISIEIRRIVDEIQHTEFDAEQYNRQIKTLYSIYSTEDLVCCASVRWDC